MGHGHFYQNSKLKFALKQGLTCYLNPNYANLICPVFFLGYVSKGVDKWRWHGNQSSQECYSWSLFFPTKKCVCSISCKEYPNDRVVNGYCYLVTQKSDFENGYQTNTLIACSVFNWPWKLILEPGLFSLLSFEEASEEEIMLKRLPRN